MKLVRIENARMNVPEPEYIKVDVDVEANTPLYYNTDTKQIVKSDSESVKTEYVSMAACKAGELCPVVKLDSHQVWELPLSTGNLLGGMTYGDIEPGAHVNTSGRIVIGPGNEAIIVAVPEEPKAGSLVHIRYFCYPSQK